MLSLFQARYLVKAISTLLNFSKTEERRIKEYQDYKVRRCRMYLVNGTPIASFYQHIPAQSHVCHPIFHHLASPVTPPLSPHAACATTCKHLTHSLALQALHTLVHVSHAQTFLPTPCSCVCVCVCVCVCFTHCTVLTTITLAHYPHGYHPNSSQSPQSPLTHTQPSAVPMLPSLSIPSLSHTAGVLVWDPTTSSCALFQQKKCFFTNLNLLIHN